MDKLLNCPFCASNDIRDMDGVIKCIGCGAIGPCGSDRIDRWNRRAPSQAEREIANLSSSLVLWIEYNIKRLFVQGNVEEIRKANMELTILVAELKRALLAKKGSEG